MEPLNGLRLENSRVVHLAGTSTDHRGAELPAAACHVGVAGWDARRMRASAAPVTCCRCLRLLAARQMSVLIAQTVLF